MCVIKFFIKIQLGNTALILAMPNGDLNCMRKLVEIAGDELNYANNVRACQSPHFRFRPSKRLFKCLDYSISRHYFSFSSIFLVARGAWFSCMAHAARTHGVARSCFARATVLRQDITRARSKYGGQDQGVYFERVIHDHLSQFFWIGCLRCKFLTMRVSYTSILIAKWPNVIWGCSTRYRSRYTEWLRRIMHRIQYGDFGQRL